MKVTKATFLDLDSIHPADLDLSTLQSTVPQWRWRDNTSDNEIADAISDVDIVVVNKVVLTREILASAAKLKLVCAAATGVNNIDTVAANELGITVSNARAYATPSVVQHVFTLLLTLTTRFEQYRRDVIRGNWSCSDNFCLLDYPIRELQGLKLGIVGYGELGKAVAKLAHAFDMQVLIAKRDSNDNRDGRIALHDLLPQVDVLTLHCPLTESTRGIVGAVELSLMKTNAILINTARGGLVDEAALLDALNNKQIGGAGLDVLEQEPPPYECPLLQTAMPNLIITPHTAWASQPARQRVLMEVQKNIEAFIAGKPRNLVTRQ